MTSGTIILYLYKSYILKNIALFNLYKPSPHRFDSVALQCGGWDSKSIQELLLEMRKDIPEYKKSIEQNNSTYTELKTLLRAKDLDSKLPDKSKNWEMKKIMEFYDSYFDEDSGNTREQGIEQLEGYLREELKTHRNNYINLKNKLDEIKKVVDAKKAVEENKKAVEEDKKEVEENKKAVEKNENTLLPILPIIPINCLTIFRIFLTIFSFFITFKLIDFNLNYLIFHIPEVAVPIITSIVLFVWEYYRFYSKVRKFYKVGKIIYMFCKKKFYSFYKK